MVDWQRFDSFGDYKNEQERQKNMTEPKIYRRGKYYKALTKQEKDFLNEYVRTGNATQSAISAGYSKKTASSTASKRLKKAKIRLAYEEMTASTEEEHIMTAREAMITLTKIATGEELETENLVTNAGVETVTKEASIQTRIQAIKEILRRSPTPVDKKTEEATLKKIEAQTELLRVQAKNMNKSDTSSNVIIHLDGAPEGK